MKLRWLLLFTVAIVMIGVMFFSPSDEKRIWRVITACEQAIVDENLVDFMEHIALHYRDDYGGTYLIVKRRLNNLFIRYDNIQSDVHLVKLNVDGIHADAEVKVRVIAEEKKRKTYIMSEQFILQNMVIYFEKFRFAWKVVRVKVVDEYDR